MKRGGGEMSKRSSRPEKRGRKETGNDTHLLKENHIDNDRM